MQPCNQNYLRANGQGARKEFRYAHRILCSILFFFMVLYDVIFNVTTTI
jgi:hypothetical protein